ncbi:MAG TPA: hypothetical protein VM120_28805 [Bryobacteraceae bacterium]|nr:hypothetical protein [Bryobacteraceae bacterium]
MLYLFTALAAAASAEIIDRIALTANDRVITESMLLQQIKLAAFYDNHEPVITAEAKRQAAETLIAQNLLLQEMDNTRYPEPAMTDVLAHWKETLLGRFASEEAYRKDLVRRGLDHDEVLRFLQLMLRSMEFIELRFRRGQQVTAEEVAASYEKDFKAQWSRGNPGKPVPALDDVFEEIEENLLTLKTDQASEAWLKEARSKAKIRFRDKGSP